MIFTGDVNSAPDQIIRKASQRFNIDIETENLEFIYNKKTSEYETQDSKKLLIFKFIQYL